MLREFSVANFLSFRETVKISFLIRKSKDIVAVKKGNRDYINKLGLLFGANASGKSNLLKAIGSIFSILTSSRSDNQPLIPEYTPFVLDEGKPISLGASFYKGDTRYDYSVDYTHKTILSEQLYYYPNGKRVLFYSRVHQGEGVNAKINIGPSLGISDEIKEKITDYTVANKSVLAVITTNTFPSPIPQFSELHDWVKNYSRFIEAPRLDPSQIHKLLSEVKNDNKKYKFFTRLLHKADFNIIDFSTLSTINSKGEKISETFFKINTKERDFELPLDAQSNGTLQFLQLAENLYRLITSPTLLCIDELGEDLHLELLYYYLMCFLYNSEDSQLLLTTQEVSLLNDSFFNDNRQLILLIEKNKETAASECTRGDEFELAKDKSFYNSYIRGRLGAKPLTGSFLFNDDDDEEA